jgi:hypothetical protein
MTNAFLKPARDAAGAPLLVRDPVTMIPLAADGEWKMLAPYWIRRLRDSEVIIVLDEPVASAPPIEPAAEILAEPGVVKA